MRLCFLTSTPLNVAQGSGTYTGITSLARALRELGVDIEIVHGDAGASSAERMRFNRRIARMPMAGFDATIGFDLDGFLLPRDGNPPHLADLKGVIADERQFEKGPERRALGVQARYEKRNVERADAIVTISHYSAERIRALYGRDLAVSVVPEMLDLPVWQRLFEEAPRAEHAGIFRILCVCRFYRRKRVDLLLRAMDKLRNEASPEFKPQLRIVGDGLEGERLRQLASNLQLGNTTFLGDVSQQDLAREYRNADLFAFPSAQEGFGIVLLEAMAAGTPILATRSAAIPEVATGALFCDSNPDSMAAAIRQLAGDAALRARIAEAGLARVRDFAAPVVARQFLAVVETAISKAAVRPAGASSTGGESTSTGPGSGE